MKLKIFRKGFNYSQDGPGNRLVYHLQGCNLRCGWCSNPEGMAPHGTLLVNRYLLVDALCPHGAIEAQELDRSRCDVCIDKACVTRNRSQAIRPSAFESELDAIVDEAIRSQPLFYEGGGVTLSGGEATLQFRAVKQLLQRLKNVGIHTCLETNGTHKRLAELFPLIDFLIVDLKHHDSAAHKAATGIGNEPVIRNIARACERHPDVLIRIPLVGGFNDGAEDAHKFADTLRPFKTPNTRFELLAYHEFGKDKWAQCGMTYPMVGGFLTDDTLAYFASVFKTNALELTRT